MNCFPASGNHLTNCSVGLAAWNACTTATAGNGKVSVTLMMRNAMVLWPLLSGPMSMICMCTCGWEWRGQEGGWS